MPKRGELSSKDEQKAHQNKTSTQIDSEEEQFVSGDEGKEDLDEVLDLADQALERSTRQGDAASTDLREVLNRKSQKVSGSISNMHLRSQDKNNNAKLSPSSKERDSHEQPLSNVTKGIITENVHTEVATVLKQAIQKEKETDLVNSKVNEKTPVSRNENSKGRKATPKTESFLQKLEKKMGRVDKVKPKPKTKISEKFGLMDDQNFLQGDGIDLNVVVEDEDLDFSDVEMESSGSRSSSEDRSSSSSASSGDSSPESESDDEPTYRRARSRKRKTRPSPKKTKRERFDRAEVKRNKKLLKENPGLLKYIEMMGQKDDNSSRKRKRQTTPEKRPNKNRKREKGKEQGGKATKDPLFKSPSTPTLYEPMLNMAPTKGLSNSGEGSRYDK